MTVFQRIRLLPLLVIVSFLSLTVRFTEFVTGTGSSGYALAQHETQADSHSPPPPPTVGAPEKAQESSGDGHAPENHSAESPPVGAHPAEHVAGTAPPPLPTPAADAGKGEKVDWRDAGDTAIEYSEVKEELYKDLAARRQELEKKEKEMATREALLKAGERELDQKLRELTAVRNEIQGLLNKQTEEEKTRIDSLVKIYEGMKAKDAARIFNTLDMNVLIQVMAKMSERKSAPILAEMNAEKARTVTILLAQQQQLPDQLPQ